MENTIIGIVPVLVKLQVYFTANVFKDYSARRRRVMFHFGDGQTVIPPLIGLAHYNNLQYCSIEEVKAKKTCSGIRLRVSTMESCPSATTRMGSEDVDDVEDNKSRRWKKWKVACSMVFLSNKEEEIKYLYLFHYM